MQSVKGELPENKFLVDSDLYSHSLLAKPCSVSLSIGMTWEREQGRAEGIKSFQIAIRNTPNTVLEAYIAIMCSFGKEGPHLMSPPGTTFTCGGKSIPQPLGHGNRAEMWCGHDNWCGLSILVLAILGGFQDPTGKALNNQVWPRSCEQKVELRHPELPSSLNGPVILVTKSWAAL